MSSLAAAPAAPAVPTRRAVVVLGMHRSGTSLVAGCLQRLGIDFGPRLMPPDQDNPHGYFEHNDVVNLHDRLLLALDRSWDDPRPFPFGWQDNEILLSYQAQLLALLRRDFADVPLWGLKDPRLCRLLPWWETVWRDLDCRPLFVLVRRAPAEVAASLARREGMTPGKAHLLWLRHVLESERVTRAHDRIFLNFRDFLTDETAAAAPVRQALGLPPRADTTPAPLANPALGNSLVCADETLPIWITKTDHALQLALAGHETEARSSLDDIATQLQAAEPFLAQVVTPAASDTLHQLEMARRQARWYEEEWQKAKSRVEKLQDRLAQSKVEKSEREKTLSQK